MPGLAAVLAGSVHRLMSELRGGPARLTGGQIRFKGLLGLILAPSMRG
jgi:hypothetical protein